VSVERRKVAPFECVVTISGDARALLRQVDVQAAPGLAIDQSALAQHAHRTRRRRVRDIIDLTSPMRPRAGIRAAYPRHRPWRCTCLTGWRDSPRGAVAVSVRRGSSRWWCAESARPTSRLVDATSHRLGLPDGATRRLIGGTGDLFAAAARGGLAWRGARRVDHRHRGARRARRLRAVSRPTRSGGAAASSTTRHRLALPRADPDTLYTRPHQCCRLLYMSEWQIIRDIARYSEHDEPMHHWALVIDGETVSELWVDMETGEIMQVETLQKHQRRGYASALYRQAASEMTIYHAP